MDNDEFEGILKDWGGKKLPDIDAMLGLNNGETQELHVRFSYQFDNSGLPDMLGNAYAPGIFPYGYQTQEYTLKGEMTEYGIDLIRKMFGGHMSIDDVRQAMEENCETLPRAEKPNVLRFSNEEVERLKALKRRVDRGEVERG